MARLHRELVALVSAVKGGVRAGRAAFGGLVAVLARALGIKLATGGGAGGTAPGGAVDGAALGRVAAL